MIRVLVNLLSYCLLPLCLLGLGTTAPLWSASGRAGEGDWPMWRYDAGRTASSGHALPEQLQLQWVRQYAPRVQAWDDPLNNDLMQYDRILEPIVAEGRVYVGFNDSDRVVALDAASGETLWTYVTDGPVRFPPVYWKGKVYFTSDDGCLHCADAATGKRVWRFRGAPSERKVLGNQRVISMWPARGGPVIQDGHVYFAASIWPFLGTFIYSLDAETGEVQWLNDGSAATYIKQPHSAPSFAGVAPQGAMAVGGDKLVVPGGRSVPAVFDRHTGKLLYFNLDEGGKGNGGSLVMADNHRFYVHTRVRGVRRFELDTGKKTDFTVNEPVLSHDGLYAATETAITAMDSEDKVIWQIEADGSGDLIRAGNRLYAAGKDTIVAVQLPHDGQPAKIVWSAPVEGDVQRLLAGSDMLLAVTLDGRILAYGAAASESVVPQPLVEAHRPLRPSGEAIRRVDELLPRPEQRSGYAILYSPNDTDLLEALLQETELQLTVVEPLSSRADELRKHFLETGLYGTRVSVQQENPLRFQAPPYIAKLVWIGDSTTTLCRDARSLRQLLASVRPYGGIACIVANDNVDRETIGSAIQSTASPSSPSIDDLAAQFQLSEAAGAMVLTRPGPLPGSAPWTHLYGSIANTVKSDDQLVKLPLGILWFGGASNLEVLPRHSHGPPEQVLGGRLFVEGMSSLTARDVYTGQQLWHRQFDDLGTFNIYYDKSYADTPLDTAYNQKHIPGANVRGTNYIVTEEYVYLVIKDRCLLLDVATGETVREIPLPATNDGRQPEDWAYVGVYDDILLAGAGFGQFTKRLDVEEDEEIEKKGPAWTSDNFGSLGLIAMNRHTGEKLWELEARHSFLHNAIVAGDGRVYVLDKLPKSVEGRLERRGMDAPEDYRLLAVDAHSGNIVWEQNDDIVGTWLGYSAEYQILLQASAAATDRSPDEHDRGMVAYDAKTGSPLWKDMERKYAGPCILYHDKILTNSTSYKETSGVISLLDGSAVLIDNPLTGDEQPWTYRRAYGCNTAVACENLLTFRSGSAGFYDLNARSGVGNFGGFKSGCSSNLIAADGVLNAPDFTRTCSCGYQNQTSLAMVHMPGLEIWSVDGYGHLQPGDAIERLGVNLGAAGDRRSEEGTVWLEFPYVSGDAPPLRIAYNGKQAKQFRRSALGFESGVLPWVVASGVENLDSISIDLVATQRERRRSRRGRDEGREIEPTRRNYTVRLYFAEPDEVGLGQRVFDVAVNGRTVLNDFDIVEAAGDTHRGIVREFSGVSAEGRMMIEFSKSPNSERGPILSGVELIAE